MIIVLEEITRYTKTLCFVQVTCCCCCSCCCCCYDSTR